MFDKRLLFPHQYYYPNMNFLRDRSTRDKEQRFYERCLAGGRGGERRMATIYIHIPFCNSRCAFCGFDNHDLAARQCQFAGNRQADNTGAKDNTV